MVNINEECIYKKYINDEYFLKYHIKVTELNLCKLYIEIVRYKKLESGNEIVTGNEGLCFCEARNDVTEDQIDKAKMLQTSVFSKKYLPKFIALETYFKKDIDACYLYFDKQIILDLYKTLKIEDTEWNEITYNVTMDLISDMGYFVNISGDFEYDRDN